MKSYNISVLKAFTTGFLIAAIISSITIFLILKSINKTLDNVQLSSIQKNEAVR